MEVVQEKITVPADKSKLSELREFLRKLCKQFSVRPNTTRRVVLAVDEAASNIMDHGGVEDESSIEVSFEIGEAEIAVQLQDRGVAFDPAKNKKNLPNGRARCKRGFGLYLIHLITDNVEYYRTEDGNNVLTLTIDSR